MNFKSKALTKKIAIVSGIAMLLWSMGILPAIAIILLIWGNNLELGGQIKEFINEAISDLKKPT